MNGIRTDIELIRVVAAFGIVWFHSGINFWRDIAYAGLIYFLVVAAYFAIKSNKRHSLYQRASRLLIPCLAWSIIYGLFKVSLGWPVFKDESLVSMVLSTPVIHLWFLPFLFFCLVVIDSAKRALSFNIIAGTSAFLGSTLLLTANYWREISFISPFAQYAHALPAVMIGVFLGCYDELSASFRNTLLAMICVSVTIVSFMNLNGVSITYLVGFIASLPLLFNKSFISENKTILMLSSLTFGVYLAHVLVLYVLQYLHIQGIALPLTAFIISAGSVYIAIKLLPKPFLRLAL